MGAEPKIGTNRGNAGKGRPKGSPNKATADVKAVAAQYTDEAIATLATIMQNVEEAAPARVAAARELLDRAHGKPKQSMDVDANVQATVTKIERTLVRPKNPDS